MILNFYKEWKTLESVSAKTNQNKKASNYQINNIQISKKTSNQLQKLSKIRSLIVITKIITIENKINKCIFNKMRNRMKDLNKYIYKIIKGSMLKMKVRENMKNLDSIKMINCL